MEIPVKAFEMIHLHTYQEDFISTYSKAACLVDTQLALAQHSQREVRNSHCFILAYLHSFLVFLSLQDGVVRNCC